MQKAALVCAVAIGVFLTVAADSGTEDGPDLSLGNESSDDNITTVEKEVVVTVRTDYSEEEDKGGESLRNGTENSYTTTTTKQPTAKQKQGNVKNGRKEGRRSKENHGRNRSAVTEAPREPAEEDEKSEKLSKKLRNPSFTNDSDDTGFSTISSNVTPVDKPDEDEGDNFCTSPPEIGDAISPVLEGNKHPVGTVVSYQCNFGHVSRSSNSLLSVCRFSDRTGKAEWSDLSITCIPRSCGDPGYVNNGRRIGNLFTFPNKVEFECQEGYKLRGLKARYCQAGGDWSGKLPTCEKIYCPVPSNPANGRALYSSREYESELKYECIKGFMLQNVQSRLCREDGTWSNDEPECTETRCKVPEAPEGGSVQVSKEPKVGSLALFSCNEGTTLHGTATSKCLQTGDWTFDPPMCSRSCEVPAIHDGEIGEIIKRQYSTHFRAFQVGKHVNHNERVTIHCKDGFSPGNHTTSKTDEVVCYNGTWSKSLQCQSLSCSEDPPPIENGHAVIKRGRHGATTWYKCYAGYVKTDGDVKCQYGKWEGYTPVCSNARCNLDQLNYPGLVNPKEDYFDDRRGFDIVCESGYRKSTWKTRISCSKGQWDIKSNPCTTNTCDDDPPSLVNGKPKQFDRVQGSVVDYECDEHFDMIGLSSVLCEGGQWEGQPPECKQSVKSLETTAATNFGNTNDTLKSWNTNLSSLDVDECFCTYDYRTDLLTAFVENSELEGEARIKKSENITFFCKRDGMDIVWPNGLRIFDRVVLTCNTCHKWQLLDLPHCEDREPGDSLVVYDSKMKFLPRGIIEVSKSGSITIQCRSPWEKPKWYTGGRTGIKYFHNSQKDLQRTGIYLYYIVIGPLNDQHSGSYECYVKDYYGKTYRATRLDLKIAEPEVRCPELQTNTDKGSFSIVYENERRINSRARYTCIDSSKQLVGARERTCSKDGKWSGSYPSCDDTFCLEFPKYNGLSVWYSNGLNVNSIATFDCSYPATLVGSVESRCQFNGTWSNPKPSCENIWCPFLNENNIFTISYTNNRKVNSFALYYCRSNKQRIIGSNNRTCLSTGQWSGIDPVCEDTFCLRFPTYNGLSVSYSNGLKVNSIATFGCSYSATLVGSAESRCRFNGTWSNPKPSCEMLEIRCPKLDGKEIFSIKYTNDRKINGTAQFFCKAPDQKVEGCNFMICQKNGVWSGDFPTCVDSVTCERFSNSPGLEVTYSDDVRVGSVASFECVGLTTLYGSSTASCRSDGTWSHSLPSCDHQKCSIDTLMSSIPEGVVVDMSEVTGEFLVLGSKVKLQCEGNLILTGTSEATCGFRDKWDHGNVQCIPGCRLKKDASSLLIIDPEKEYYRFGEFVLLSCPPGKKLTSEIERVMCLEKDWSDPIPGCKEWKETSSSGLRATTRKSH